MSKNGLKPFVFESLEHGYLEKKYNIEKVASADARAQVPAQGALQWTATELEAIGETRTFINRKVANSTTWTSEIASIISNKSRESSENPFLGVPQEFQTKIDQLTIGQENEIRSLRENKEKALNDLRVFKLDHNLQRDPTIKPGWLKIVSLFIPIFLIASESYFNGSIFGGSMPGGQLEGIVFAVGISLVNVLGSFVMGMTLPWLWYKETALRIWGSIFLIFYILIITFMNLTFGVFRSSLELDQGGSFDDGFGFEGSSTDAFFIGNPFTQLETLETQGLLFILVGFLFALISLLDGLFYKDTYYGFGYRGEKLKKANDELEEKYEVLKKNIGNYYSEFSNKCKAINNKSIESIEEWRRGIEFLQGFKSSYDSLVSSATEQINHFLNQYIAINRARRMPNTEPAYWPSEGDAVKFDFGNELEFNTVFAQLHGEYLTDTEADTKKREFSIGLETNYVSVMKEIDSVNEQFRETVERLIN